MRWPIWQASKQVRRALRPLTYLEAAEFNKSHGTSLAVRMKLCRTFSNYKHISNEPEFSFDEPSTSDQSQSIDNIIQAVGASPVKLSKRAVKDTPAYLNSKKRKVIDIVNKSFECDATDTTITNQDSMLKDLSSKAEDIDELMMLVKQKLMVSPKSVQIKLLTLIPQRWTISYAASYFHF